MERGVPNVELIGVDANDGSILIMPTSICESELPALAFDQIVIGLDEVGRSSELWSRKLGKWVKVKSVYNLGKLIQYQRYDRSSGDKPKRDGRFHDDAKLEE